MNKVKPFSIDDINKLSSIKRTEVLKQYHKWLKDVRINDRKIEHNRYNKVRTNILIRNNLCITCANEKPFKENKRCISCIIRNNAYKRRANKLYKLIKEQHL